MPYLSRKECKRIGQLPDKEFRTWLDKQFDNSRSCGRVFRRRSCRCLAWCQNSNQDVVGGRNDSRNRYTDVRHSGHLRC